MPTERGVLESILPSKVLKDIQHEGTLRDGMGISSHPYFCISLISPKPLKKIALKEEASRKA